ncbi:hypothetical protein DQQ10_11120 [Pseudochryseolinea flava]|uniref:Uncharacterized protein n=1 Tax=Pseudochryseolinea flava TaxID=2059302 RepID=A0A364Y544_9BACT|nr:hypothetical protein DQQ10_11120 [Pseudochryseolinea flava]
MFYPNIIIAVTFISAVGTTKQPEIIQISVVSTLALLIINGFRTFLQIILTYNNLTIKIINGHSYGNN